MRDTEPAPGPDVRRTFANDAIHLLRTTQTVQYQLSQMADQKASMLLGITFVIFTISIGQARGAATPLAVMVLGGAAFVAAFLTVLAVLPSVKVPPKPDGPANILFFGSFTQEAEDRYVEMLLEVCGETRTVYEAMARDVYQNGAVLARKKYKLLGYAYRVLLVGLVLSLLAFLAPMILHLFGMSMPAGAPPAAH
ncbi:Pycsar system effector family protein [Phenylobacterium sp.]|uniref:Pycsar system effector family protein n=1 Tax=Phenylobacterium sp. TaxID=1871053 RepID=UPI0025D2E111|nr:Pycsar system effector family protein [Phenylobacterium sp.]MBX3486232.1 hypothetical protein [Phenylobacterium sp.]MCW5760212.1 hypothetical protein [Phenylobacterium sp.]